MNPTALTVDQLPDALREAVRSTLARVTLPEGTPDDPTTRVPVSP